jgi:hypothetical protein
MHKSLAIRSFPHTSLRRSFSVFSPRLAGHNKVSPYPTLSVTLLIFNQGRFQWSKIKDKKGVNDAQKSVLYTKANHVWHFFVLQWLEITFLWGQEIATAIRRTFGHFSV